MSSDIKRNAEGYKDGTAYKAIMAIDAEQSKKLRLQEEHCQLIRHLKYVIKLAGFELDGRIKLVHKSTGKKFE